tara:strand:- start:2300 stop:3652 length:1353 start_codon:yes stop_codon:yes gene_type:complete
MHILFVENRSLTLLLESIAEILVKDGHKVSWLVQNHLFKPSSRKDFYKIHIIPYPPKKMHTGSNKVKTENKTINFKEIIPADRGVNFFGNDSTHYSFYYHAIESILDNNNFDLVFGETTLFHELITEYLCDKKNILYLHPVATRIPANRLQFFKGRTMTSIGGDKVIPKNTDVVAENKNLGSRNNVAFMNEKSIPKKSKHKFNLFLDRAKVVLGFFLGETYNTPGPIKKFILERNLKLTKINFLENIHFSKKDSCRYLLYPMQMQPETNIDIWSGRNSCQTSIINEISTKLCHTGFRLLVKFNPHSKYELLDSKLLELSGKVDFLPNNFSMDDALELSDAVISLTGSIILECISMQKPIFVIGNHEMSQLPGVNQLSSPGDIEKYIGDGLKNYIIPSENDGIHYLNEVYENSYSATWFDPINMSEFNTSKNILNLLNAFRSVISVVENKS